MESVSASKNAATAERPKLTSKPMRIHELLGLPKSAGKAAEQHRLEPVRVKYLFEPMGDGDKQPSNSSASARRTTVAPSVARNVRRQLLQESADAPLLDKGTPIPESQPAVVASATLFGNVSSHMKPVRLGLSKSDGKAKTNHQRLQPVRIKFLMESWEKSQTVKPEGQKSTSRGPRATNVRRKLYSVCPSPVPPKNAAGKSSATNKLQETINTAHKSRINANKSAKTAVAARKPTRKSCLLPPNSIRDQHIVKRGKEAVAEEPPTGISAETQKIARPNKIPVTKEKRRVETAPEIREIGNFPRASSTPRVPRVADSVAPSCDQRNFSWLRDNFKHYIRMTEERLESMKRMVEATAEELMNMRQMLEVVEDMATKNTETEEKLLLENTEEEKLLLENTEEEKSLPANTELEEKPLQKNMKLEEKPLQENKEPEEKSLQENKEPEEKSLRENKEPEEKSSRENAENSVPAEIPKIVVLECTEIIEELTRVSASRENEILREKSGTTRDENFAVDSESDKENVPAIGDEASESAGKTRRRSARLAAIEARSPDNRDDSFSRIESELNITHAKTKPATPLMVADARRNGLDPRSKRSIREYMMIKSCATFLQTPDHKGLPTPRADRTGTPAERRAVERALSRQLLSQLTDLYDDSPE